MNFFDLVNISERYMELVNPCTPEKVLTIGRVLGLEESSAHDRRQGERHQHRGQQDSLAQLARRILDR